MRQESMLRAMSKNYAGGQCNDHLHCTVKKMKEALSTPLTPTALNELIEKVEKRTIDRCAGITAMSIIDMPTTVEISTVRKYSKAIRALPVGHIKLEDLL